MVEIPKGYCQCGCGRKTKPASQNVRSRGWIKGEPVPYVNGHRQRKVQYVEEDRGFGTKCWIWQLYIDRHGYGKSRNGLANSTGAHRVYYEKHVGPIPDGMPLDHLCRVRACVNPDHLEPVTPAENSRRGLPAKLTEAQVKAIRREAGGTVTQASLARKYGIGEMVISKIVRGISWKGVEP